MPKSLIGRYGRSGSQAMPGEEEKLLGIVLERLRADGGRMTKKREQVLRALLTFDRPAAAEEIRERAELPASDLVTVYRNLETFERLGVLQRVPLENGTQLFELTAPDEHYHHLICRECHKSERLDICVSHEVVRKAKAHGYSEIAHLMEVYGVCEECGGRR
ncbi:Fur family transcriptional regulator [Coraliomargarita sinensis]|uniref:Fur family transcriptional regulator n=1 Tax=Coraliomargarita sinensis TaxID=2174842 RepID=UPI001304B455|nr:Fur family transcriptional regulator [Coraliomargarita sinensis]